MFIRVTFTTSPTCSGQKAQHAVRTHPRRWPAVSWGRRHPKGCAGGQLCSEFNAGIHLRALPPAASCDGLGAKPHSSVANGHRPAMRFHRGRQRLAGGEPHWPGRGRATECPSRQSVPTSPFESQSQAAACSLHWKAQLPTSGWESHAPTEQRPDSHAAWGRLRLRSRTPIAVAPPPPSGPWLGWPSSVTELPTFPKS